MKAVVAFVGEHQVGTPAEPRPAKIVQLMVRPEDAAAFAVGSTIELTHESLAEALDFPIVPPATP